MEKRTDRLTAARWTSNGKAVRSKAGRCEEERWQRQSTAELGEATQRKGEAEPSAASKGNEWKGNALTGDAMTCYGTAIQGNDQRRNGSEGQRKGIAQDRMAEQWIGTDEPGAAKQRKGEAMSRIAEQWQGNEHNGEEKLKRKNEGEKQ